jgi:hypothetical protein
MEIRLFPSDRRVSLALGIPIVLLCGVVGAVIGVIAPPPSWMLLMTGTAERAQPTASTPTAHVAAEPSFPTPEAEHEQIADARLSDVNETTADPPDQAAEIAPVIEPPPPAAALHTTANLETTASAGEGNQHRTGAKRPRSKVRRSHGPKRQRQLVRRETTANRARSAGARAPPERTRPIISQIPILGPVVGLIIP